MSLISHFRWFCWRQVMALSMFILHLKHLQLRLTNSKVKLSFGSKLFQVIWKANSLRCVWLLLWLKFSANLRVFFKLSGAKVLRINGADPFVAVNKNAKITGGYQAFGTRQNSYDFFFLARSRYEIYVSTPVSFRATIVAQLVGNTPWATSLYRPIHSLMMSNLPYSARTAL